MSGSLANRLVEAAEAKLNELHAADGVVSYPTAARWATVAVLRTLAESGQVAWAESLAGLADAAEKGERS